jgi:glycosyltransferase involved in cell wall biosynthesis
MASDRVPLYPPIIRHVENVDCRPLWSVMVPVYNCSEYLRQALGSILLQDPGVEVMQIEVVDDCSTDADVEQIVQSIGRGRIGYFRQEKNVGSLRNFETCLNRSKGRWVHLLHGDDFLLPGFYAEIGSLFEDYPEAGAAFTGYYHVGQDGTILYPNDTLSEQRGYIDNWLEIVGQTQPIQPPAIVVKRSVYEVVGSFFGVHYGEDWEMWVRISSRFPMVHSPRRLANYRVHNTSISSRYFNSGQNIKDIFKVINIIQAHLPVQRRKALKRRARRNFSIYFARTTDMVYHLHGNPQQALKQAVNALKMNVNRISLYHLLKIAVKIMIRYKFSQMKPLADT